MIMNRFNNISLFGGAMTVRLPANFIDVSDLRQVPDNQEVFLNSDGFESITVDILERVEGEIAPETTVDTDLKALKYHVREIVDSDEPDISSVSTVTVSHLPLVFGLGYHLLLLLTETQGRYSMHDLLRSGINDGEWNVYRYSRAADAT